MDKLDIEVQKKTAERMKQGVFTFNDLLAQLGQVSKMGSMQKMMNMIPGINKVAKNLDDEKMNSQMKKSEAIILSMTEYERENPSCLKASRKNRIAKGAGVDISQVNKLVKQFEQARKMMKSMPGLMGGKGKKKRGGFKMPFGF